MFERDYFLKKHKIVLDTSKSVEEQILQMTKGFGVQDSVSDDRPYIFISYAHKDSAIVLPAIKALQDKGYPVWYDAGIRPGTTWSDYIADHVRDAALVIAFMSKNAIESHHCQSEIRYAFNNGRPMLTVMLDNSKLPSGLEMQMSQWQMFSAHLYDGDTYLTKLAEDGFIASTAGAALNAYMQEKRLQEAEAERQRKEKEEEKRKRQEAKEAARKQKEVEELERIRKEVEAAEELNRKKATLVRRRREAEEAEHKRREEADAELRRMMEEEAELERQNDVAKRNFGDLLAAEKKYQETKAALEAECERRKKAESRLGEMRKQIIALKADKTRHAQTTVSPKVKAEEEKLAVLFTQAQEQLYRQSFSGYKAAVNICIEDMAHCEARCPEVSDTRQNYINEICARMYHDARVFERNRREAKACCIYSALPATYRDVDARKKAIDNAVNTKLLVEGILLTLFCLTANFLLVSIFYAEGATEWNSVLIHLGPLLAIEAVYLIANWEWWKWESDNTVHFLKWWLFLSIVPPLIATIFDPFLYPKASFMARLGSSGANNAGSAVCMFFCSFFLLVWRESRGGILPKLTR